jgi:hypothetical protein
MTESVGLLAYAIPHGQHRADSWPAVVRCTTPGCPFRRVARGAPDGWTCIDHRDEWAQHDDLVASVMADRAHVDLTAPPTREDDAA